MVLVGGVIAVSGFLSNRAWSDHARGQLDEAVAEEAREFVIAVAALPGRDEVPQFAGEYFLNHQYEAVDRVFLLQLAEGTTLSLHAPPGRDLFPPDLPLAPPGAIGVSGLRSLDGEQYRIAAASVSAAGEEVGTLYVAEPTAPVDDQIDQRIGETILIGLGGLLVAGIGAYFIARVSMAPISGITRAARSISQKDLSRRLDYRGARDEVGELASAFDEMIARLDQAFEEQRRLLADLSHQLRTPITVIRGHLDLVRRHPDLPRRDSVESIDTAIDEVDRMNRLVGDLLLLGRTGALDFLKPSSMALRPFLQEVMQRAEGLAERSWVTGDLAECSVVADRDQLMGALLNLLENAVHHTETGDSIGLDATFENGWATVNVRDSGQGIPEEDVPHIFERFYQASAPSQTATGGSGLGLTIVDAVVRAHGGSVRVEADQGEGATFIVRLPATR
ncbi:MAG: sensor histidine kinase [Dehalococcoidia bacterium]